MRPRRLCLAALGALAIASCGSGDGSADRRAPATVANVGELPEEPRRHPVTEATALDAPTTVPGIATSVAAEPSTTTVDPEPSTTTVDPEPTDVAPTHIGDLADGNRVLIVGDSIMEATGEDNGGRLCSTLVSMGWHVGMDATNGRHIDVGAEVLERRLGAGWDAAVIALGSNYDGEAEPYAAYLGRMLRALAPRPVLLVTVTEFEDDRAEVNYILRGAAAASDNVRLLEWGERTRLDPSLTGDDGLHLSERGRAVFVAMVGVALGPAPGGADPVGACVDLADDDGDQEDGDDGGDGEGDDDGDDDGEGGDDESTG